MRPIDGAMDLLPRLIADVFDGRAHLISKAGPRGEERTRRWLDEVGLLEHHLGRPRPT